VDCRPPREEEEEEEEEQEGEANGVVDQGRGWNVVK
jgi:hypothetical protein